MAAIGAANDKQPLRSLRGDHTLLRPYVCERRGSGGERGISIALSTGFREYVLEIFWINSCAGRTSSAEDIPLKHGHFLVADGTSWHGM